MRKIGASLAIAALAAVLCSPTPGAAFGVRLGPFYVHFPFYFHRHWHRHYVKHQPADQAASRNDEPTAHAEPAPGPASALLYPALALPAVYDEVFWPPATIPWPFTYAAIFQTAFARADQAQLANACQQPDRAAAIVDRIKSETNPTNAELPLVQRLGGALTVASGYLAKACPNDIPPSPVARLQLMEWQIEKLAQALDIVRQPLQDFEQALDDKQRARFAGRAGAERARTMSAACAVAPTAVDWSIERISLSVQPTDSQRDAIASLKQAFGSAASELDENCPWSLPASPLARLEATEARLDATWRAVVTIQVALEDFQGGLSDEQKARFDQMDFAAAQ